MIIATWNVNSINARIEIFKSWAKHTNPDFILLQETKCEHHAFPTKDIEELGYHAAIVGQKAYNGVAILSKTPHIINMHTFQSNPHNHEARYIEALYETAIGKLRVISVYVPNGASVGSEKYQGKLEFLKHLKLHLKGLLDNEEKVIIGGDFNVAPFDIDVYNPKEVDGSLGFSNPEKELMRSILNSGYLDCYRTLYGNNKQFTWWDYRGGGLVKDEGWRIDFLLVNSLLADHLEECFVDTKIRHQEKTSDHAPVVAKFKRL